MFRQRRHLLPIRNHSNQFRIHRRRHRWFSSVAFLVHQVMDHRRTALIKGRQMTGLHRLIHSIRLRQLYVRTRYNQPPISLRKMVGVPLRVQRYWDRQMMHLRLSWIHLNNHRVYPSFHRFHQCHLTRRGYRYLHHLHHRQWTQVLLLPLLCHLVRFLEMCLATNRQAMLLSPKFQLQPRRLSQDSFVFPVKASYYS